MPDRNHIAAADEKVRLAERDAALGHLRGAGDDEQRIAVLLDFRPLMRLAGVLDRQVVEVELLLHAREQLIARFVQADPNDMAGPFGPCSRIVDRDIGNALAARVDGGGDDARFLPCTGAGRCLDARVHGVPPI